MTDEEASPRRRRTRGGAKHRRPKLGPAGNRELCPTPHKLAHHTEGAANRHVDELVASGKVKAGDGTSSYRCQCGAWHVGHDRTKARRRVNGRPPAAEAALLDAKLAQLVTLHGRRPGHPGRR